MKFMRLDDHRIKAEEIIRYSKAIGAAPEFNSEIELSSGNVIFTRATPDDIDNWFRQAYPPK